MRLAQVQDLPPADQRAQPDCGSGAGCPTTAPVTAPAALKATCTPGSFRQAVMREIDSAPYPVLGSRCDGRHLVLDLDLGRAGPAARAPESPAGCVRPRVTAAPLPLTEQRPVPAAPAGAAAPVPSPAVPSPRPCGSHVVRAYFAAPGGMWNLVTYRDLTRLPSCADLRGRMPAFPTAWC